MIKRICVPMAYSKENAKKQVEFQKQKLIKQGIKVLSEKFFPLDNGNAFEIEFSYQEKICISKFIDLSDKNPGGFVEIILGEKVEENGQIFVEVSAIHQYYGWIDKFSYRYYKSDNSTYNLKIRDDISLNHRISALKLLDYIQESFSNEQLDSIFSSESLYY